MLHVLQWGINVENIVCEIASMHAQTIPDCCCVAMRSEDSRLARDDWHSGEDGTIGCRLQSEP